MLFYTHFHLLSLFPFIYENILIIIASQTKITLSFKIKLRLSLKTIIRRNQLCAASDGYHYVAYTEWIYFPL